MNEKNEQHERIKSNDPKVIEFLKYLGVDTRITKRVYIYIETDDFIEVQEFRSAWKPTL